MKKSLLALVLSTLVLSACTTNSAQSSSTVAPTQNSTSTQQGIAVGEPNPNTPADTTITGAFTDLINSGTRQCTFNYTDTQSKITSKGTVYIHNAQLRADTTVTSENKKHTGSVIIKGDTMSAWSDEAPQGITMSLSKAKAMTDKVTKDQPMAQNMPDINQKYDYACTSWVVDNNQFAPPADIQFLNLDTQMDMLNSILEKQR